MIRAEITGKDYFMGFEKRCNATSLAKLWDRQSFWPAVPHAGI